MTPTLRLIVVLTLVWNLAMFFIPGVDRHFPILNGLAAGGMLGILINERK